MSKSEKDLYEKKHAKLQAARHRILEEGKKPAFQRETNKQGTPVVPSYGLTVDDILTEDSDS